MTGHWRTRRRLVRSLAVLALLAPGARAAATGLADLGRPGVRRGERPGVDEALRRTVTLVLRAEARTNPLPAFMIDPTPLPEAMLDALVPDGPLPDDLPVEPVPAGIDRRLPHSRRGSVWVAAGTWMMEVDPIRRRIVLIAHDVLPPDI